MQGALPEQPGCQMGECRDGIEVSVVMPCLNEDRTVGVCVDKARSALERLGVRGEVIVADNGSTDNSTEEGSRHGARVVRAEQRGYGWGFS